MAPDGKIVVNESSPAVLAPAPAPGVDPTDREKFEFDKRVRSKELELKQAETTRLAEESKRSRLTNPFVVAVVGATLVGIGNAVVSVVNAKYQRAVTVINAGYQRALSDSTNQNQGYLESVRAENTNVLEVIKLGDPDKVRNGLCLLLKLNTIKSSTTSSAIQSYVTDHQGCPAQIMQKGQVSQAEWATASLTIPGCGSSGCYQPYSVCGSAPANTRTTGNTRNYVDSFGGAWGDWGGSASITGTQVCRTFTQHSHNVSRTVSFQFEVVPLA